MPFTLRNIKADLEDIGSGFDGPPDLEFRAATKALALEQCALSYQRVPPGYRFPYGHTHKTQEEVYVVVSGSGRLKVDDDVVELEQWDAVRVPPGAWRGYEAGPAGLELLVVGAPNLGDATREDVEGRRDWWADERSILGSLRSADGVGVVRMEDSFDVAVDDLWSALTDPVRLAGWFADVEGDLRVGGEFRARIFLSGEVTGTVDACEPPRRLLLTMRDADPQPGQPEVEVIEVTLADRGDQTVLVWEERGMPLNLLAAYGVGVQIHVEDLGAYLAGRERGDAKVRWGELLPAYEALAAKAR